MGQITRAFSIGLLAMATAVAHAGVTVKDPDKAIEKLEKTCAKGRSAECGTLAELFLIENHMTSNARQATNVLERICRQERKRDRCEWPIETMACRRVGEIYAMGQGVPKDAALGIELLTRASDAGDARASMRLGLIKEKLGLKNEAHERYALACHQADFLSADCGIAEAPIKAYAGDVALACERTAAEQTASPTPASVPAAHSTFRVVESEGPHKIKHVRPQYPKAAMRAGLQGTVKLDTTVDQTGHVTAVEVLGGPGELIEAAVTAVKQWEYTPYLLDGQPVPVKMTITVNFHLQ